MSAAATDRRAKPQVRKNLRLRHALGCISVAFLITSCSNQPESQPVAGSFEFRNTTPSTSTTAAPSSTTRVVRNRVARSEVRKIPLAQSTGSVWDRLAQCEAGGRWNANTGNGYYGGLQMDMSFWRSYGQGVAPRPDLASREQQIAAAERARDSGRGYHPWPTCARRLGLIA